MDTENWFSQAIQNSSSLNTPPRSNTPRSGTRTPGGGLGLASRRAGAGQGLADSQGSAGGGVDAALLNESISLGKRYQDEYSGGSAKKVVVASAAGSPVGVGSQSGGGGGGAASTSPGTNYAQPHRFGSSLYSVNPDHLARHSPSTPLRQSRLSRIHHPRRAGSGLAGSTPSSSLAQSAAGSYSGGGGAGTSPQHAFATPILGRKRSNTAGSANSAEGSGSPGVHAGEDDRPPTISLASMSRDEGRGEGAGIDRTSTPGSVSVPNPAPSRPTTSLLILGVPYAYLAQLEPFLSKYGPLARFELGPAESNYVTVAFESEVVAMRLLRQSGQIRFGGYLLGVVPQYDGAGMGAGGGDGAGGAGLVPSSSGGSLQRVPSGSSGPSTTQSQPQAQDLTSSSDIPANRILPQARADVFKPRAESAQKAAVVPPEFAFGLGDAQGQQQQQQQGQAQAQQVAQPSWMGGVLRNVGTSLGEILFGR